MSQTAPPRFLIDANAIRDGRVRLTGDELHHMHVRRLRPGNAVRLFDSHGTEYDGVVERVGERAAEVAVTAATRPQRESPLHLTLAQAVLKGAHLDLVIEKTTELGVEEILLFTCARSVPRPPAGRRERWRRVAASAAKQSGRLTLPVITGPVEFDGVLARVQSGRERTFLFHPSTTNTLAASPAPARLTAIIGPEGGFAADDLERAAHAGCTLVGLGPRILRAETAAVSVATLCQFLWGDLGLNA